MKKLILLVIAIFTAGLVFAQNPISGSWRNGGTKLGFTIDERYTFSADSEGEVQYSFLFGIDMKLLGNRTTGEYTLKANGHFVQTDNTITIVWDQDSIVIEQTKALESWEGGVLKESNPEGLMDSALEQKKVMGEQTVLSNVKVKGDKLTVSKLDDKGKKVTVKFEKQ